MPSNLSDSEEDGFSWKHQEVKHVLVCRTDRACISSAVSFTDGWEYRWGSSCFTTYYGWWMHFSFQIPRSDILDKITEDPTSVIRYVQTRRDIVSWQTFF